MATLKRLRRRVNIGLLAVLAFPALGVIPGVALKLTGWRGTGVLMCVPLIAAGLALVVTGVTMVRHHRALVAVAETTGDIRPFFRWLGTRHHRTWAKMSGWLVVAVGVWWATLPTVALGVQLFGGGADVPVRPPAGAAP